MSVIHQGIEKQLDSSILLNKWKLKTVYGEDKAKKPNYCLFNNTSKALKLLDKHIKNNSKIVLHTDVDVDGVGTTYILKTALKYLGSNNHIVVINRDKVHGIQQKHVDYFKDKDIDLVIVTDSSSNDIGIIKQFNCDVLCIDHHELLHTDMNGFCVDGKSQYVIVNNTIDENTYSEDIQWIRTFDNEEEYEVFKATPAMSCGLVVYELLRIYSKYVRKEQLLENLKLYQWVGTTLFTDAVDTLNDRNQWYLDNTVFSNEIERCMSTMMHHINKFKATLDKSYIEYSFAPIINKAIRAGKSGEVIDKVINNPASIYDLNIYNENQLQAIEKATLIKTIHEDGTETKERIAFTKDYITMDISRLDIHPNYSGVIASRLCGDNHKSAAVYTVLTNGNLKGSFRGKSKEIDYRKYFSDFAPDVYAQGHPPAFGFELKPEQLEAIMQGILKIEPKGEDKSWLSLGNVDDEHKGIYHITDLDEFRKQGLIWKIALGNAKVTSKDEILIKVSAKDLRLTEIKGKVYIYNILGLECKAFKPLEGDFFDVYIEYSKEINIYIR